MSKRTRDCIALAPGLLLAGCLLDDVPPMGSVHEPTLIAIVAEPAEAMPGEQVTYRSVVATPHGPQESSEAAWSFCRTPRSLSENTAVSVACATTQEQPIAAGGLEIEANIPMDACARFGPETLAGLRPTDPDGSGGYYQPIRLELDGQEAVFRHRVRCALANAPFEVARRFQSEYQPNRAPGILRVQALDTEAALTAGERVKLTLDVAPDAAESYLVYDLSAVELKQRTERLDVRWYASAGKLEIERSSAVDGHASARWAVPERAGSAWIWVVLRDDRGGVSSWTEQFEVVQAQP
jgi:hypothetical protein